MKMRLRFDKVAGPLTLENFHYVLVENSILGALFNTIILAGVSTIIVLLLAVPAAYSLARYRWKYNDTTFFFILTTRMGAPIAFGIPFFLIGKSLNLLDTFFFLTIVFVLMNIGFAIWILKGFFEGIPKELRKWPFCKDAVSRIPS